MSNLTKCLLENACYYDEQKRVIAETLADFYNSPINKANIIQRLKSKLGLSDTFKNSIYVGKLVRQIVDEAKAKVENYRLADTIQEDDELSQS